MNSKSASFYAWLVVALLWFVALLNYLDRLMITTMRDSILADIHMNDTQFGLLTSMFLWIYGIFSPIGGFLADKFSRKKLVVISLLVWSAVTLLMGFVHTFHELLVLRAVMGVSEAFYIPAGLALIADYHQNKTRSLATGIHMSGLYTGSALGGVGGFIAEQHGWRYGFHLFGFVGIAFAIVVLFILKDKKRAVNEVVKGEEPKSTIGIIPAFTSLLKQPQFRLLLAYFSLLGFAFWSINGWLPTYLREHFKLGLGEAGMSATLYVQVASFIGVLAGGFVADRWVRTNIRGRIFLPVIGFGLAAPALMMTSMTTIFALAIVGLVVFGIARGFSDSNVMPILCQVVDKRYRATGYGILNFLSTICGGIMIYVGGWLKDMDINLSVVFLISAIFLLVAAICMYFIRPVTQE